MERDDEFVSFSGLHCINIEARIALRHLCVIVGNHVLTAQQHALQFYGLGEFDHRLFALWVISHAVGGSNAEIRKRQDKKRYRHDHTFHNKTSLLYGYWPSVSAIIFTLNNDLNELFTSSDCNRRANQKRRSSRPHNE